MKIRLLIFTGLILTVLLFVNCTGNGAQNNKGEPGADAEFVLNTSLPGVTQNILSYKILPPNVTTESVATLGAKLGFTGDAGPIDPGMIGMSNTEKQEIFQVIINSGTIEYTCLNELFSSSPTLPKNDEAVKIATEFLKLNGLWHSDLVAEDAVVGGTSGSVPTHLLVRFTRYINGYPVTGPGNKFAVRIGDKGKVVRLLVRYDDLAQNKEIQIIDAATAFDRLQAGNGVFTLPIDCKKVKITNVSLGYYLESISEKQENMTPYYIFHGECLDKSDAFLEEFTGWVDAFSK